MSMVNIPFEAGEANLDWLELTQALAKGHDLPRAQAEDTFLYRGDDTILSRAAWIDGLGIAVKTASIFPGNPEQGRPAIGGSVCMYDDRYGHLTALLDFHLVTKWKTAGDSLLGALRLANPDSRNILIVGAGTVGESLCAAFAAGYPQAKLSVWNRTMSKAEAAARKFDNVDVAESLPEAVHAADIVVTATMSNSPVIHGEWLRPGQHLNLIGAFRPDMREADDVALQRAQIYVDSFESTVDHIGEIRIPLEQGTIARSDLIADFYDLNAFSWDPSSITAFKNGGGAHLDLMTSRYILDKFA